MFLFIFLSINTVIISYVSLLFHAGLVCVYVCSLNYAMSYDILLVHVS